MQFQHQPSFWHREGSVEAGDDDSSGSDRLANRHPFTDPMASELLELAGTFEFDALRFCTHEAVGNQPISIAWHHMERKNQLLQRMRDNSRLNVERDVFETAFAGFLNRIDALYRHDAIYHGSSHAVDVMSTTQWFLKSDFLSEVSKPIEQFMAIVAAAIHDVGHPGGMFC
jgi:hypothetical protein